MWCIPVDSYANQYVALLKPKQQVKPIHSAQILLWKMSQWFFQRRQNNSNNQINGVLGFFIWMIPFHTPLFYYLRLSCFAIKGEFSELPSKQKSFTSVDIKHFKTEGKNIIQLGGYFWRNFKCAPIWKKAKHQNPKILCKTKQTLSAIAVLLLRITFPQPEQAQQLQLLPEYKRSGSGNAIDFLSE